jgi:tRNA threonylcarbamoyladenosine biosynthesis protein TsaB
MKSPKVKPRGSKGSARSYSLALEGATYEGSVALLAGATVVAERTIRRSDGDPSSMRSGERLMPAVAECLAEAGVERGEIARIVCGAGPGSFTSLRVAASVAKGLATGYGVELFAVSSLLLAVTGARPALVSGEYLSVLNAMRGEFFAQRVALESAGFASPAGPAMIISVDQLAEIVESERGMKVIGPAQLCDIGPHARGVAPILESIIASGAVDLASWEPDYGRLAEAQVRWEAAHGRPLGR